LQRIGQQKKIMGDLSKKVLDLDMVAEQRLLTMEEWDERIETEHKMEKLINIENLTWKQRVGKNWILQGDANSKFFHQFISGRRRKNSIMVLDSENGEIRGQEEITKHIVAYYKDLFGPNDECSQKLKPNFWADSQCLLEGERDNLVRPFTLKEIKDAVMDMKENSAPGPNGYGVIFFKKFWEMIEGNLMQMFADLYEDQLDLKRLNYGVITLIPKLKEANTIKQYRPICLLY